MKLHRIFINCRSLRRAHTIIQSGFKGNKTRDHTNVNISRGIHCSTQLKVQNESIDNDNSLRIAEKQCGLGKNLVAPKILVKHEATSSPNDESSKVVGVENRGLPKWADTSDSLPSISESLDASDERNKMKNHALKNKNTQFNRDQQKNEVFRSRGLNISSNRSLSPQAPVTMSHTIQSLEKTLRDDLLARPTRVTNDFMSPTPSQLLRTTLQNFLPFVKNCSEIELSNKGKFSLPPGHHLVYFHPKIATSNLLSDGTDDLHYPGFPFERRLWVGGSIEFTRPMTLFPKIQMTYSEKITDVRVMGSYGNEKIFIDIACQITNPYLDSLELKELKTLVFMRRKESMEFVEKKNFYKSRMEPSYSISIRPTRTFLFRFSALTFNAHRIHLDSTYCRQVEGLKSMVVHGPLTIILMLAVLKEQLPSRAKLKTFSYKNIMPLYVEEDMRICVKKGAKVNDLSTWYAWIEGPNGEYTVKGTATVSFDH